MMNHPEGSWQAFFPHPSHDLLAGLEKLIPRRTRDVESVMQLPLTRSQRSIYLLVDGRRTIADLCRCTRRSVEMVEQLLRELQEKQLVVF